MTAETKSQTACGTKFIVPRSGREIRVGSKETNGYPIGWNHKRDIIVQNAHVHVHERSNHKNQFDPIARAVTVMFNLAAHVNAYQHAGQDFAT